VSAIPRSLPRPSRHARSDYLTNLIQICSSTVRSFSQEQTPQAGLADLREIALTVLAEKTPGGRAAGDFPDQHLQGNWPRLALDRRRIAFAISALLDNAIKFTPRRTGGVAGETSKDGLQIVIRDTGIGIPARLPRVFRSSTRSTLPRPARCRFPSRLFYAPSSSRPVAAR